MNYLFLCHNVLFCAVCINWSSSFGGAFLFLCLSVVREETGKIVVIRKAETMCFFAHDLVKFRKGCVNIGMNEYSADAAAKCAEEIPADEGKFEHEDLPFFAVGHLLGNFECAFHADLRVLRKDIGYHAVFVGFDYTRNDEKQAPEENLDIHHKIDFYDIEISSAMESIKEPFEFGAESSVLHEVTVIADNDGAYNKSAPAKSHRKSENEKYSNNESGCHCDERICEEIFHRGAEFAEELLQQTDKPRRGKVASVFDGIFRAGAHGRGYAASGAETVINKISQKSNQKRHPISETFKAVFCFLFDSCACPHKKTPP